jgi:hypothetical protein
MTLVAALALAFLPLGPAPVIALTESDPTPPAETTPDPGQSPAPDPTPGVPPDPTPSPAPDPTPAPDPAPTPSPDPAPTPTADVTPTPDPTSAATPTPDASPTPTPTPDPSATPSPNPSPSPTPTPTPTPTPSPAVKVSITQTSNAPDTGRHRVDPGSTLRVEIGLTPEADLSAGTLVELIPSGWTVTDASEGTYDAETQAISWEVTSIPGGTAVTRSVTLTAPSVPATDGTYVLPATFAVRFEQATGRTDGPHVDVIVAPRVVVDNRTLGQVDREALTSTYLAEDAPIIGQQRFDTFRVRFAVRNSDSVAVEWTPQLEYRDVTSGEFVVVPIENVEGVAFRATTEWIANPVPGGGTMIGPDGETIVATLVTDERARQPRARPPDITDGRQPDPADVLASLSFTAVEFSARATVDAAYLTGYEFRVSDAGRPLAGAVTVVVGLGPEPPLLLTPGQREGVPALVRARAAGRMRAGGGTGAGRNPLRARRRGCRGARSDGVRPHPRALQPDHRCLRGLPQDPHGSRNDAPGEGDAAVQPVHLVPRRDG